MHADNAVGYELTNSSSHTYKELHKIFHTSLQKPPEDESTMLSQNTTHKFQSFPQYGVQKTFE